MGGLDNYTTICDVNFCRKIRFVDIKHGNYLNLLFSLNNYLPLHISHVPDIAAVENNYLKDDFVRSLTASEI